MLLIITQVLRFTTVVRSARPRQMRGTSTARVRASTVWTKVVADSLWTHSGTWLVSEIDSMRWGTKGSMSLLPMDLQHMTRVSLAASFTALRMSTMQSARMGTISGR
ncbi:hypothetical protein ATCV1_z685R [Acanthocystis turfacea chlorella virus 1]|uniref:Uncharacterized protein z685R n=1 Tax=Chlorovirus heliozoae TaxID=322019 RepID=A7K9U5_9PHYC|nr:hypothetical protein ATCV1_z685R [Acanthocystis turfacea chlorella virus 1]ABT16819.1 hypothetical protein ATCV1_z685R [Acanthocystis turfacea chlorella virus 1]